MSGQKGSLLDKIKAFFIRRKELKKKKKELERKELEAILKNISEKVVPPGGVIVHAYSATENINLKKVSLNNIENKIHVVDKKKEKIETLEEKTDEILDLDEMSLSELKALKSNISPVKKEVPIEEKILNEVKEKDNYKKEVQQKEVRPISSTNGKQDINIQENSKKEKTNNSFKAKLLFNSKGNIKIDKEKTNNKNIIIKPSILNIIPQKKNKDKIKSSEEELSVILIRMIDKNLYELDYLKQEINYLTESNKKAKTKEEIFEIEQRFLILKERLESVYREFLEFRNSNVFDANLPDFKYNEEFSELVSKYKLEIYDNDVIKQTLLDIENKYKTNLNILESIVALEESKEVLGDEIYSNKNDIYVRDEKLSLTEETITKIDFMKSELEKNVSVNKDIVNSAIEKVNSIRPEERVRYQFHIMQNLLNSAINFSFSYAMLNPRRGRLANALGAVTMLNGIRSLTHVFEPTRQVYYVASSDFENEINEHLNDFSYIKKNIDLSIDEISKLKTDFTEKYVEYIDEIPEINNMINDINKLEEQLKDIKIEMNLQEVRLNQSLNKNNALVKQIENN